MFRRSARLSLAVTAVLATSGLVRAESNDLSLNSPLYLAAQERRPAMAIADMLGVGSALDDARIDIRGHIEGGWTYNFDRPDNQTNVAHVFDFEDQDKQLNQIDIMISRDVDVTKGAFDIGFNMEWMWGSDARLIHANGLNFYGSGNADVGGQLDGPNEQFDLVQANIVLALPIGNGVKVTMGKFVTPLGYETINPLTNPFYSRSVLFGYAIPLTHTGVLVDYQFNDQWAMMAGITRGWEQGPEDNNGSIDGIGQIRYNPNDKLSLAFNAIFGPEQPDDSSHYRTVIDIVATYQLGDNTKIGLNFDWGYGSDESNDGQTGNWNGVAVYVAHKFDERLTFNARAEWFNDDDGARGLDTTIAEVTLGVTITPMPDNRWASGLMIRPEIRWDHADHAIFDDGAEHNQFTVGGDIIFAF